MALTLAEMIEEVRTAHAQRQDLSDARITRALNFGQERVAREPVHWKELERLVSHTLAEGQYVYTFPNVFTVDTDVHEIFTVHVLRDGRREKLEHRAPREFDHLVQEENQGQPRYYTWWGTNLYVQPKPEEEYTARIAYGIWPNAFDSTVPTAVSDLQNKDGIIVAFAISHLFQVVGSAEDAARWYTIARDQLSKARQSVDYVSDPTPMREGRTSEYWRDPFVRSVYSGY